MIILPPNLPRVIIFDGLCSETRHEHADGITVIRHDPPVRAYFIDYVDEEGCAIGVWDGTSYAAACAAAHGWQQRDGVLIDDRVSDEGGRA